MSYDGEKAGHRMIGFFLLLFIGALIGIVSALVKTQYVNGEEWRKRGVDREHEIRIEPARRGNIYSSDGKILATTLPVCDLYLDLGRQIRRNEKGLAERDSNDNPIIDAMLSEEALKNGLEEVCRLLAEAEPSHSINYYKDKILAERGKEKPSRCFRVQKWIPYSTWEAIRQVPGWKRAVVNKVDGKSVIHQERAHIYGNLGENVIGFRNSTASSTYTGLEGYYDSVLRGQDGEYWCRRLTKGVWVKDNSTTPPFDTDDSSHMFMVKERIDGSDIVSTIDTRYQDIAESSLREALSRYGAYAGCAILMEMETGYILACSNLTRDTAKGGYREMTDANIACSDLYEPGSTFKTVILSAMMNDTTVHVDTAERVRVGYKIFSKYSGEINDGSHATLDTVSVARVLEMSSNVGMCELGWANYRNRRDDLKTQVQKIFPFEKLMIDLRTSEYRARVNDLKPDRDFLNFCYGYSTRVSALQVLTFYNAIGAGGRMVKPLFCKGVMDGKKMRKMQPVVLNEQICSPETAMLLRDMLVRVVENGTGNNIKNNTYGIAGKTGTSVYDYANQHLYNASFAGFFPAENPKYSCLVVVKRIAAHGRQAAAPVFKSIADCVMSVDKAMGNVKLKGTLADKGNMEVVPVPKGRQTELRQAYSIIGQAFTTTDPMAEWVVYTQSDDTAKGYNGYVAYELPEGVVPDCKGMTAREALALLHKVGLKGKVNGCGRVVSQSPQSRSQVKNGTVVTLKLENR